jgi:hypothetical protein
MTDADIRFYFDPVCPFAWMTSKWVRVVAAQRDYAVDWRFISLRMINSQIDYDSHFPAGYEQGHTSGLRLLRVAARTRVLTHVTFSGRTAGRSPPSRNGRLASHVSVVSFMPSAADSSACHRTVTATVPPR